MPATCHTIDEHQVGELRKSRLHPRSDLNHWVAKIARTHIDLKWMVDLSQDNTDLPVSKSTSPCLQKRCLTHRLRHPNHRCRPDRSPPRRIVSRHPGQPSSAYSSPQRPFPQPSREWRP